MDLGNVKAMLNLGNMYEKVRLHLILIKFNREKEFQRVMKKQCIIILWLVIKEILPLERF